MPKVVDHDAYRAELLTRAFELFAQSGYGAVTMRGVATNLKVSTGTLYHYFETKDDMFEQMVRHVASQAVDDILKNLEPGATPLERVDTMLNFVRDHEVYLRNFMFLVIDYHRAKAATGGATVVRESVFFFRDAIVRNVGSVPAPLATLLLSGLLGTLLQRTLDEGEVDFTEQATYLRTLIAALQ
jgi:AcrR family transcriptional regulator